MRKVIGVFAVALTMTINLCALEVDRKEVTPGKEGDSIEFINYNGPYTVINTVQEIQGIGSSLGLSVLASGKAGDKTKYYIIHAVDPAVKTGFDADLLILGPDAGVDHIDNLRRILSAYLQSAYGYSEKDSTTLAKFITVYNAVYRGKIDTFKSRYKPLVCSYLTADKAGLSVRYDEWPGRTQIVIPLSDMRLTGTVSTIDTTALTDKAIVDKIKEDKTTAIDNRKDMLDLKQRETDAAQTRADTAQKDAAAARDATTLKQEQLAAAQKEAQAAQTAADAQKTPEAQKAAEDKKAVVEQKKAEIAATQDAIAKKEEVAKADQTLADTKQKEVIVEQKEIATDVQKDLNAKTAETKKVTDAALASAIPGYGLKVIDTGNLLSQLVLVNLNDGSVLKTSTLNTIRGRTLYDTGAGLLAIAGKKGGNSAIKLVLIDSKTLEITTQGSDTIAESSVLVQNANDFYAVIEISGKYVVGRFDKNLDAKAKSSLQVQSYTPITVTAKGILVQDSSGNIKLLRASDLTE